MKRLMSSIAVGAMVLGSIAAFGAPSKTFSHESDLLPE